VSAQVLFTEADLAMMLNNLVVAAQSKLWDAYLPDEGDFARHLFPKHVDFCNATADEMLCTIFGANRSGKSMLLAYIVSCFAMGKYPTWWKGRKFEKPVRIWVAGQTMDLVKESTMLYLFGHDGYSGFIEPSCIEHLYWNPQSPGILHRVHVRHASGGLSEVRFKSYDQGWQRFQSGTVDVIVMDEEMPAKIFSESITRTATTNGIVLLGFTALQGLTPLVNHLWPHGFVKPEYEAGDDAPPMATSVKSYHTFIGWKDIPYSVLGKERREQLMATYMPHEVKARTEGIPSVGSGMVYPVEQSEFLVKPFEIPEFWPKAFALDPGYSGKTAGLWAAWDQDSDTIYLYSEYYQGMAQPPTHADAIRRRGSWIPCIIDPAGANMEDGKRVKKTYVDLFHAINDEWPVHDAIKSITAGVFEVYTRLSSGRMKVFNTLHNWVNEFVQYHKDDEGRIVKTPCHLLDDTRYLAMGTRHFATKPVDKSPHERLAPVDYFG
jgi:phage terminase large subunit-like protein